MLNGDSNRHEFLPVKGQVSQRINSSGILKKTQCELCTSSPFATAQVTFSGRDSNLNSLKKASASAAVAENTKSGTCQMTQLINESKYKASFNFLILKERKSLLLTYNILFFILDKQLRSIKESQALELKAQRLTLQEQRSHIAILEQALMITKSSVEQLKARLASIQK